MNLLATNYFIATEAELPEIYAVYLEKLAEINANPGVTIVLLSDTEEPAEHQSVYEELLLTEFAPTDDRYPSVLSSKVLVELP